MGSKHQELFTEMTGRILAASSTQHICKTLALPGRPLGALTYTGTPARIPLTPDRKSWYLSPVRITKVLKVPQRRCSLP